MSAAGVNFEIERPRHWVITYSGPQGGKGKKKPLRMEGLQTLVRLAAATKNEESASEEQC